MNAERRLVNRITSEERAWINPRDYGLSREQVKTIAAKYGKKVVWQCVDFTDQLLLIAEPGQLPLRTKSPFTPRAVTEVVPWLLAGLALLGVTFNLAQDFDVHATLAGVAGLVLAGVSFSLPRLLPRTMRVAMLAREFNGSPWVRIKPAHYPVSALMIGYVAATYGYHYVGLSPGPMGPTLIYSTRTT
ncbi:hypothetical protein SAMN05421504_11598 [Amycolatopsis xylanica]|uniref:Uncharacterized protein n=1 Tax=Amycolatopsis xylanica TaxID=589385 RepID=A0A1H3STE7_9PSEU|nr:hypothetical protein [Amycolatopsis xylanica]SDZ41020.1 hypothetical protein SAMN05421504_11598 [Amycolatopsis xylanica]